MADPKKTGTYKYKGKLFEYQLDDKGLPVGEPIRELTAGTESAKKAVETETKLNASKVEAEEKSSAYERIAKGFRDAEIEPLKLAGPMGTVSFPLLDGFKVPVGGTAISDALPGVGGTIGAKLASAKAVTTGAAAPNGTPFSKASLGKVSGRIGRTAGGYGAGAIAGSLLSRGLEHFAPAFFGTADPNKSVLDKTVSDVSENAFLDTLLGGAAKVGKGAFSLAKFLASDKPMEKALGNYLTKKYAGSFMGPGPEQTAALLDAPEIPISVGDVLQPGNKAKMFEGLISPFKKENIQRIATIGNFQRMRDEVGRDITTENLGKDAAQRALRLKSKMESTRNMLWKRVENMADASTHEVEVTTNKQVKSPRSLGTILGTEPPVQDVAQTTKFKTGGVVIPVKARKLASEINFDYDAMIKEMPELEHSPVFKEVTNRLDSLDSSNVTGYKSINEFRKVLNDAIGDKRTPARAIPRMIELKKALDEDIADSMKVAWTNGEEALKSFEAAKKFETAYQDKYNTQVKEALDDAIGENSADPFTRGARPSVLYDKMLDSTESLSMYRRVAGRSATKQAFVKKVYDKFIDETTKQIDGNGLLSFLDSANGGEMAKIALSSDQRRSLRYIAQRAKTINPDASKVGSVAIEFSRAGLAINTVGKAASFDLKGLVLEQGAKLAGYITVNDLVDNVLLNPRFARQLAVAMGRPVNSPQMAKSTGHLLASIQGAKVLLRADSGEEFSYDTDTKKTKKIN
jgi:hypothetical protein